MPSNPRRPRQQPPRERDPFSINKKIQLNYRDIVDQCISLFHDSITTDLGWEYGTYHLWNLVATWACFVFMTKYQTPMSTAPQYSFFRTSRPDPAQPLLRDEPVQTRSRGHDNLNPGLPERPHLDSFFGATNVDFRDDDLAPENSPRDRLSQPTSSLPRGSIHPLEASFEEEESFQEANTSFGSSNSEFVERRTPDGAIFCHRDNPSRPGKIKLLLPTLLIENKPFNNAEDVTIFLDKMADPQYKRQQEERASELVREGFPQLREQAQFLLQEYPSAEHVHGIVASGWWWQAWKFRRDQEDPTGIPLTIIIMKSPVSLLDDDTQHFHADLARIWAAASQDNFQQGETEFRRARNFGPDDLPTDA